MASLNKLAIRGIRSFDDKNISVIEFFSPVTVIVGHNGSGKTTIIECLKYATTGDQPPNTRGGAFVHDPSMANEKEVKAQVKLRFHAANGTRMLVVRNLSVTKKKNGLTMKTLEGILSTADNEGSGKRGTISTKCAEMDAELPHLLGVSKAVLENVIFCHQEDSYWPLAEASVLKKKFDDIFEASRYTKALDSIKNLRKERIADQKAEKIRLESLSKEKTRADELLKRINDIASKITAKEVLKEEAYKESIAVEASNTKFSDQARSFNEVFAKYEQLLTRREGLIKDIDELKPALEEVTVDDEELAAQINNFEENIAARKKSVRRKESALSDAKEATQQLRLRQSELISEQGALMAQRKLGEENISKLESNIRNVAARYQIPIGNQPLKSHDVNTFFNSLSAAQKKQNQETEALQSDGHSKTNEYLNKQNTLRLEINGIEMQRTNIEKGIRDLQRSITEDEEKTDAGQNLSGDLQRIVAEIEEKRNRVARMEVEINAANYPAKIEEKNQIILKLEAEKEELNDELKILNLQGENRSRLKVMNEEFRKKIRETNNIMQNFASKFKPHIEGEPNPETLECEIDEAITRHEQIVKEAEEKHNVATRERQAIEARVSNAKNQLTQKQIDLRVAERKLREEVETESLADAIKEALDEINVRKETTSTVAGSSKVYESLLKQGKNKKCCTVCSRHMDDKEMLIFEKYLLEQIQRTSKANIEDVSLELQEWEKEYARLQDLLPVEATRDRLKTKEIPALESQIAEDDTQLSVASSQAAETAQELHALRDQQRELNVTKQHASTVKRLYVETEKHKSDIQGLEKQLSATGSIRTVDDVQNKIQDLSDKIKNVDRERAALMKERDFRQTNKQSEESNILREQIKEKAAENSLEEIKRAQERAASNRTRVAEFHTLFKELGEKLKATNGPLQELESELGAFQTELREKLSIAQQKSQDINREADRIQAMIKEIKDYERRHLPERIENCNKQMSEVEADITESVKKTEQIEEEIRAIQKEIHSSGAINANLRENSRFRRLEKEVADIDKAVQTLPIEEAGAARTEYSLKWEKLKEKEDKLKAKHAELAGEISSMKRELDDLKKDHEEYKGITKKYTDQLVKVKMGDMANADLEKYAKALDNAIMKYHSLKMAEVNDTMRHLWNRTYQGTDIDGIKIVSDNEGTTLKRTYNYKVVMTKDQVEMDMRGRCSAGQKMLASIIIRLALADSFGQNCGILALDEPTNALDTENIEALAESLVDIINQRKNQSNFQLIIITHDENFLRILGKSDVISNYWRISRDSRQKSVIELERLGAN